MPPSGKSANARKNGKSEKQKAKVTPDSNVSTRKKQSHHIPLATQQQVLNVFEDSFPGRWDEKLPAVIQEVKHHLYNRDFAKAFGDEALLEAYALRWSPSRALAYMDVLCSLPELWESVTSASPGATPQEPILHDDLIQQPDDAHVENFPHLQSGGSVGYFGDLKIACLGGGAGAELIAFCGYIHHLTAFSGRDHDIQPGTAGLKTHDQLRLSLNIVDIADWSSVIRLLRDGAGKPHWSKYASATAKANQGSLVNSDQLSVGVHKADLLEMDVERLAAVVQGTDIITIMFTLNELYNTSMSKTTNLLLSLTYLSEPGAMLLVIDSPGSYSTVGVGSAKPDSSTNKYPMQWLIDHTLLEASAIGSSRNSAGGGQWEKVRSTDSKWYRIPPSLKYPIDLEDMRYQLHLYKRK
ncbi:hypothetical protein MMC09_004543 [Bachmanniomyces sp. S44760]|nr:hypothetical protein [Bachmanniomyces sp. S44760]